MIYEVIGLAYGLGAGPTGAPTASRRCPGGFGGAYRRPVRAGSVAG